MDLSMANRFQLFAILFSLVGAINARAGEVGPIATSETEAINCLNPTMRTLLNLTPAERALKVSAPLLGLKDQVQQSAADNRNVIIASCTKFSQQKVKDIVFLFPDESGKKILRHLTPVDIQGFSRAVSYYDPSELKITLHDDELGLVQIAGGKLSNGTKVWVIKSKFGLWTGDIRTVAAPESLGLGYKFRNPQDFTCGEREELASFLLSSPREAPLASGNHAHDFEFNVCLDSESEIVTRVQVIKTYNEVTIMGGIEPEYFEAIAFEGVSQAIFEGDYSKVLIELESLPGAAQSGAALIKPYRIGDQIILGFYEPGDDKFMDSPSAHGRLDFGKLATVGGCKLGFKPTVTTIPLLSGAHNVTIKLNLCSLRGVGATGTTYYEVKKVVINDDQPSLAMKQQIIEGEDISKKVKLHRFHHNSCDALEIITDSAQYGMTTTQTFTMGGDACQGIGIAPPNRSDMNNNPVMTYSFGYPGAGVGSSGKISWGVSFVKWDAAVDNSHVESISPLKCRSESGGKGCTSVLELDKYKLIFNYNMGMGTIGTMVYLIKSVTLKTGNSETVIDSFRDIDDVRGNINLPEAYFSNFIGHHNACDNFLLVTPKVTIALRGPAGPGSLDRENCESDLLPGVPTLDRNPNLQQYLYTVKTGIVWLKAKPYGLIGDCESIFYCAKREN